MILEPPLNKEYNENIFAINEDGTILWQIESREYLKPNSCYVNIVDIENGIIQANGWDSVIVKVDVLTGKIISEEWIK